MNIKQLCARGALLAIGAGLAGLVLAGCSSSADMANTASTSGTTPDATSAPNGSPDGPSNGGASNSSPKGASNGGASNGSPNGVANGMAPAATSVQAVQPTVPMDRPGNFGNSVTLEVVKTSRVKFTGQGPGEVSGTGIRFDLKITNGAGHEIDLNTVTPTVAYGKARTPASPSAVSADQPFSGVVAPGQSATGSYVFTVPKAGEDDVEVQVSYSADQPIVVFAGRA